MAAGDIWSFTMIGRGPQGEQLVTVMHLQETTGSVTPGIFTVTSVCEQIETNIINDYLALITSGYTYVLSELTRLVGAPIGINGHSNLANGQPGQHPDPPSTIERTGLITKDSHTGGRRGKGRIFTPMPPSDAFTYDGLVDTTTDWVTRIGTFTALLLLGELSTEGFKASWCVYHRSLHTASIITEYFAPNRCGVQRRRREGIGA